MPVASAGPLGSLFVGIEGPELTGAERRRLRHSAIGGVVLFGRNCVSADQVAMLTRDIRALRRPPLLVAIDQEGGRVQRLRDGFTRLPPMARLGHLFDRSARSALAAAEDLGWLMAEELLRVGVDFSFAPVLDVNHGVSDVIGDRAFHQDPEVVSRLALAWTRGARAAGMASVGKHFPGHGGCAPDTHLEQTIDDRALADLEFDDLVPFRRLAANRLEAIMASHVVYPDVDHRPAGFSPIWLGRILRDRLGFQGAVFSDDLGMAAVATQLSLTERVTAALVAGCDAVLACNEGEAVDALLDDAQLRRPAAALRLVRLHSRDAGAGADAERRGRAVGWAEHLAGD